MAAPVPEDPVKLPPVILMPSKRTVAVVPPWPMGLNTFSTLAAPATVHLVVGSKARPRCTNVGATAHATSSPSLGIIVVEAANGEGQFAWSTKRLAVLRESVLILASMSSLHPMLTTRGAASASE